MAAGWLSVALFSHLQSWPKLHVLLCAHILVQDGCGPDLQAASRPAHPLRSAPLVLTTGLGTVIGVQRHGAQETLVQVGKLQPQRLLLVSLAPERPWYAESYAQATTTAPGFIDSDPCHSLGQ